MRRRIAIATVILAAVVVCMAAAPASRADLIWWDGTRDSGNTPPGKLLTDNIGYYGESVMTGVSYCYETEPDVQQDVSTSTPGNTGRLLLDGSPSTGIARKGPISLVMDFRRNCRFSEIDVLTQSHNVSTRLELADQPDKWKTVFDQSIQDSPAVTMHRIKLPDKPQGRYLRVTVGGADQTRLDEIMAWGDADVTPENPEQFNPVLQTLPAIDWCQFSIPGIDKTGMVYNEFYDWQRSNLSVSRLPVVWSQVPTWNAITTGPILPKADKANKPIDLTMARNLTECAAVALTNVTWRKEPLDTRVSIGEFRSVADGRPAPEISAKLRVAGAIPSCIFGVVLGPLFEADNMLGLSVLKHYITNADGIHGFPDLTLPAMSSVVLWLSVTTDGAEPGLYQANLTCSTPDARPLKIRVNVLDVTVPKPLSWTISYSNGTSMFPFNYDDRGAREVEYRHDIGLNVYHGFPDPGTVQEAARKRGDATFLIYCMPGDYVGRDPKTYTDADVQKLKDATQSTIAHAKSLGLGYDEYYLELGDEPGTEALVSYEAVAKIMHGVDPQVRIYANPTTDTFGDWYDKHIAVSAPFFKTATYNDKSVSKFSAPRWINGYYVVATNSAKGERTDLCERYRRLAWESISRGWNGWGFYAYFRPEGDPWNDFDLKTWKGQSSPDFEMVYPGPRGPIATRQSEAVREGMEDFRLMYLLRQKGLSNEFDAIVNGFRSGVPLSELRLRALKAAASAARGR